MKRYLAAFTVLVLVLSTTFSGCVSSGSAKGLQPSDEGTVDLPKYDISGTVFDPDGKPLAKADVWLYFSSAMDGLRDCIVSKTRTDGKGHYHFSQSIVWEPVCRSNLSLNQEPPKYAVIAWKQADLMGFQAVIDGDPLDNVNVTTQKMFPSRIRIKDCDKKTVAGVKVMLASLSQKVKNDEVLPSHQRYLAIFKELEPLSGITDEKGCVKIFAMEESSFKAKKDGYAEGYSNSGGPVILFPGAKVSGTVKLPDGTPLANGAVRAEYQGNRL